MTNGKFVISLDFEKHWGFFDNRHLSECKSQLSNVDIVINQFLEQSRQHNVCITFATVGILFAKSKAEIYKFIPNLKPNYSNTSLDAYKLLQNMAVNDEKFYFGQDLVSQIKNDTLHEMATHTFSHYYCQENGQTDADFYADLTSAVAIASHLDISLKSIVFPRNQVNSSYLKICEELGIETYRGNCWFNFNNNPRKLKLIEYFLKTSRMIDSYLNLTGSNSFKLEDYNLKRSKLINIPASRFLRPYTPQLGFLEPLKINRIKNAMTKAAKRNEVYHLWWHPHNFANNINENFKNFSEILEHYSTLRKQYNFESITMQKLGEEYRKLKN
ncbi:polysaccharide deacetylase [Gelidibacter sediminis]|uniref:Polysaccharide deacetylase n=1 Tax=Gelidibacter sediminis TaxID=1608710 RepID=A0A4R7PYC6_9FLAO|nr:polysaccharide deacetylase family protein [Gelidibacter sediminis]TDU40003.1 polysaccharide deacetylase [Gelidibacter sediminis]